MFTALDLKYAIRELQDVVGALFDKAYQLDRNTFLFQFHKSGQGKLLLMVHVGEALYLTAEKKSAGTTTSFAMFLRKKLEQQRVAAIAQKGFERIVEITFSHGLVLILELFSKGNILLLEQGKILACWEEQTWKDRTIKKGLPYQYPPLKHDPFSLDTNEFQEILQSSEKGSVVQSLAVDFGLSGRYAEEVCLRAGVQKKKKHVDVPKLLKQIHALGTEEIRANIVLFGDSFVVNPIDLNIYAESPKEYFSSFHQALAFSFTQRAETEEHVASTEKTNDRIAQQRKQLEELEKKSVAYKELGDLIYAQYEPLESLLQMIKAKNWNVQHPLIKELKKTERKVVVTLDGKDVALDITKNIVQNATFYYDIAKKAKRKIPGAQAALQTTLQKSQRKERKENSPQIARKKVSGYRIEISQKD
ncbi:MAG: NFACT family protein [Nanoarchaeota archaeon]